MKTGGMMSMCLCPGCVLKDVTTFDLNSIQYNEVSKVKFTGSNSI